MKKVKNMNKVGIVLFVVIMAFLGVMIMVMIKEQENQIPADALNMEFQNDAPDTSITANDDYIKSLEQMLAEKDSEIASLKTTIDEKDTELSLYLGDLDEANCIISDFVIILEDKGLGDIVSYELGEVMGYEEFLN